MACKLLYCYSVGEKRAGQLACNLLMYTVTFVQTGWPNGLLSITAVLSGWSRDLLSVTAALTGSHVTSYMLQVYRRAGHVAWEWNNQLWIWGGVVEHIYNRPKENPRKSLVTISNTDFLISNLNFPNSWHFPFLK